jgi:hypothetical protein
MEKFLLFLLASVGLTQIIIDSKIMQGFRDLMKKVLSEYWYTLFECYMCCGFWTGIFCGTMLYFEATWSGIAFLLCCGFASSLASTVYSAAMNWVESMTVLGGK